MFGGESGGWCGVGQGVGSSLISCSGRKKHTMGSGVTAVGATLRRVEHVTQS